MSENQNFTPLEKKSHHSTQGEKSKNSGRDSNAPPNTLTGFTPRIVAFCCNWCSYAGADLAGVSRMQYPPTARIIKVMCSSRVDPTMILKAFLDGADGVLVAG